MADKYVSLALGGGGARGLAHIGVLRAFEERKIVPSFIVGTSMGAVIGAMFAQYRNTKVIEERVANLVKSDFMHKTGLDSYASGHIPFQKRGLDNLLNRLRQNVHRARVFIREGTIPVEYLFEAMEYLIDDIDISELKIPFCAVATDLNEGKAVFFRSGSVRSALTASAAIPGVFTPFEYNGVKFIDGGATYLTPVPPAKRFGTPPIVAVDVSKSLTQGHLPDRGYSIFFRSGDIAMMNYNAMLVSQADVVIRPDVASISWADFYSYPQLIERGYLAAQMKISEVEVAVQRAKSWLRRWWRDPKEKNGTV